MSKNHQIVSVVYLKNAFIITYKSAWAFIAVDTKKI